MKIQIQTFKADVVIIDPVKKKLNIFELTVPLTSNLDQQLGEKSNDVCYERDVPFETDITENTTTVNCFKIGFTGFIIKSNRSTLSTLHSFMKKDLKKSTFLSNLNALAWYGSYKIWLTREEPNFVDPPFPLVIWPLPKYCTRKLDTVSAEIFLAHYLDIQLLQTFLFSLNEGDLSIFMFYQEWCCFLVYCGVRGHFDTHSLWIYGSNLTNVTYVGLCWSRHVIWEYIWRLMYTRETPHKCKRCDFTSIIASHLKRQNEKDACFISEYENTVFLSI